jgi:hypothetical protein
MKHIFIILILFIAYFNGLSQNVKNIFKTGQQHGGGIIFYVDESGEHGLISAPVDQTSEKVMWGKNGETGASSTNNGQENTNKIIKYLTEKKKSPEKSAACICDNLILNDYNDWYLPSINELKKLYENSDKIENIKAGDYCSSTEYEGEDVYAIHFKPDKNPVFYYNKDNKEYLVRCIRKF